VMLARQQLTEPFVVISGDSLTDIDLAAAVRFHRSGAPSPPSSSSPCRTRWSTASWWLMKVGCPALH